MAETAVNTHIGIFTDGACIINDEICRFTVHHMVADFFKDAGQLFRIPGIHLAAKGNNGGSQRSAECFSRPATH